MVEPQQSKKTGCSMESMWRDLPASVLERVFTFLPIASLCRFRTLSKEWNMFITGPTFKRARAVEENYMLITQRWGSFEGGWVVLDVARKRLLTVSHDFLAEHVRRQGLAHAEGRMYLAATDGGLFCVRYIFDGNSSGLFVCNPVLRTVKQLPHAAGVGWDEFVHETVVMATDRSSMEYEIIVVNTTAEQHFADPQLIHFYESRTGRWRTAPVQPSTSHRIWWKRLTIFNSNLYCLAYKEDSPCAGFVSCDKQTGVVSHLEGIDFPVAPGWELVASEARLFCVIPAIDDLDDSLNSLEIFEIDVVKRASTRLTQMPLALLMWVMDKGPECRFYVMEPSARVVTASADCIFITADGRRCAAYSLSHKSWYQFPEDLNSQRSGIPRGPVYHGVDPRRDPMYGSNSCLSLCAP